MREAFSKRAILAVLTRAPSGREVQTDALGSSGGKRFKTTAVTKTLPGRLKAAGQRRDWPTTEPLPGGTQLLNQVVLEKVKQRRDCISLYNFRQITFLSKPQFPCNMELLGYKTVLDCKILIKR